MARLPAQLAAALATLACVTLPARAVAGEVYKYTEKDGTIVYTNVPPGPNKGARKLKGSFNQAPSKRGPVARAMSKREFNEYIEFAARKYRVPEHLVKAVMHVESNFDTGAVSNKGASGLMQLMPGTAREMYVKDIFDARENIEGGTRYLRHLANLYDGDMVKMVAAYNAGPDAVAKYGGKVPPYEETQAYVRKVIALYFQYKEQAKLAQNEAK
ncbi:MAG: transglycosylase SLT domain-containing protein [Myxococcaceae bacterium]